ncbi:MAG: 5'/3'-nucleotidase SurE [Christensenellales bacterium]|jgi:5'-nucleotidase
MKIFVSNDDGIGAQGIGALVRALGRSHEVFVCAPDGERSAISHAITLRTPIRAREVDMPGAKAAFALSGTPADCIKIAYSEFGMPDAVFSGVNHGENVGVDVIYSGTVAAAAEAVFLGVPAVAVSVMRAEQYEFGAACHYAQRLARYIETFRPQGVLFNLNTPACATHEIKGLKFPVIGLQEYSTLYQKRIGEDGQTSFFPPRDEGEVPSPIGCDVYWLHRGFATLTPIQYDLTDKKMLATLAENFK